MCSKKRTEMPLDSSTLPPPFSSLMCTNIRADAEGRECACCVFDSRGQHVSLKNPPRRIQARAEQGQDSDRVQGCVTRGNGLFIHSVCTNLIYRDYTGDINLCMRSVPVSVICHDPALEE